MREIIFSSKVCYSCFAYRAVDKRISKSPVWLLLVYRTWAAASFYHHSVCWNNTTALCLTLIIKFWKTFFIFFGLKGSERPFCHPHTDVWGSHTTDSHKVSDTAIQTHDDTPGGPRCGVLSHVLSGRLSGANQPCCDWNDPSHTVCLHRTAHSPK